MAVLDAIAPTLTDYPRLEPNATALAHDERAREILADLMERKRFARWALRACTAQLIGEEFSRLLVLGEGEQPETLRCECSCGVVLDVARMDLAHGNVTRCQSCEISYRRRHGKAPE
jgi:hypothetical protein